jgi:hypothetical protein
MVEDLAHASAHRRAILGMFIALLFFLFLSRFAFPQVQPNEYEVKAAFIFHFAQMVEWPSNALGANAQPLVICTLDDDSYSSALTTVAEGKLIGSHPVQTRLLHTIADVPGCHVLVVGGKDKKRVAAILAGTKDAPLLTVGDSEDFAPAGGIIGLLLQDNKIRFDVNLIAARRANLKISSRLLVLARSVIGGGKAG